MLEHHSNTSFVNALCARWRTLDTISYQPLYDTENLALRAFIHGATLIVPNEKTFEELCFLREILEIKRELLK